MMSMVAAVTSINQPIVGAIDPSLNVPSIITTGVQTASTIMVAVLIVLLARTVNRRFVNYWSTSWIALSFGLVALNLSFQLPNWSRLLLTAYWVAGDLFGFLLYAGCRDYSRGIALSWKDAWLFAPPMIIGVILPGYYTHINVLFPPHAIFFGGYCLLAFAATLHAAPKETQTRIGLRFLQFGLLALVILFWHYSIVLGVGMFGSPPPNPGYLQFSSLYDSFLELTVAFAQVILATDSVRQELANANRQLAAASEQLALAARTDALTGLLNRRAFESLLQDPSAAPGPGAVAVIDVNDLKPLNDRHGHSAGDDALRGVARALQARTRIGDPIFRLGGDEFMVLLPGVSVPELTRRLEELDQTLCNVRLPGLPNPIDLTVSWGVAEYRDRSDLARAVDRADAAMYSSKQARKKKFGAQAG